MRNKGKNKKKLDDVKLGSHWDGKGVDFKVFSSSAEKVELCLFDETGIKELSRIKLSERENGVWHAYVPNLKPGQVYGYRVHGLNAPEQGYVFNEENVLLDPYAREVLDAQSGGCVLGRVVDNCYDWEGVKAPNNTWSDTIIYEMHPKGFTKTMPEIPEDIQGKIEALGRPEAIAHLKELGVTAVELLPIHAFQDEEHLQKMQKSNYWGYNTVSFFAPHPAYLKTGSVNELKDTIKALHKEGIEVILDVVYNHTAEGGKHGPVLSFKGLDNQAYYRLVDSDKSEYINETGCGNTLNITHPATRKMVLDSLRYWVEEFKIDGFRFDLATSLGRNPEFFDKNSKFFEGIKNDPILSKVKLIAEPWDIGHDGYKLGDFPAGWHEWNDRFRDDIRSFWRGDFGKIGDKAQRVSGSSQEFASKDRTALSSINLLTAHDGFTLHDLVTYNDKHNEANGEDNRDGHGHNLSNNYGVEGETSDTTINALRQRQKKNMLASLFLSHGTPMLLAGDEFGNSQQGNNNAYCQDNEIGWLNWDKIEAKDEKLKDFTKDLIKLRKANPILTQTEFLHGTNKGKRGLKDITWIRPTGREKKGNSWNTPHSQCLGALFNNAAAKSDGKVKNNSRLLVIYNASSKKVNFKLPRLAGGQEWTRVIDTVEDHKNMPALKKLSGEKYPISERSVVVFTQKR